MASLTPTVRKRKIQESFNDKFYYLTVNFILLIIVIIVLYPLIYIVSSSFSSRTAILNGQVFLWPVGFTLEGYSLVFGYKYIGVGYINSLIYTTAGTVLNVFFTMVCAFPLSRKKLPYVKQLMFLFTFTMFFGGGMIPNFMLIRSLGLIDTRMVMIIPGLIGVYNMIIARTFIQNSIPEELYEAARIDGCNNTEYFFRILLPLSKAVMAVLALQYGVSHWNAYFNAYLYLNSKELYPLQIFLRQILVVNTIQANDFADSRMIEAMQGMAELLKYALIVIGSVPVIVMYPFVQKHFIKGVMIGSVKG